MPFDIKKILNREQREAIVNAILTPFSWAYGAGVWLRNMGFKFKILPQVEFDDVTVVSVGNVTVGGTGKTPHVEYIVEALCRDYNIAVLSRGYKRATKGFILASDNLGVSDLGDEPYQIYRKFNGLITLAVCEKRVQGIRELKRINPDINLIILDDGFQHRYVKPKVNIVLVDYNRPPFSDKLLPLGGLREPWRRIVEADIVVVTKCPSDIKPVEIRMMKENLDLYASTPLFYSNVKYAQPVPVFPIANPELASFNWVDKEDLLLGLTGIANHRPFMQYLKQFGTRLKVIHYDDHHNYTRDDFKYIFKVFEELEGRRKFIITTEKDAVRILNNPYFPPTMRKHIYYVPIRVGFLSYGDNEFIPVLRQMIETK